MGQDRPDKKIHRILPQYTGGWNQRLACRMRRSPLAQQAVEVLGIFVVGVTQHALEVARAQKQINLLLGLQSKQRSN